MEEQVNFHIAYLSGSMFETVRSVCGHLDGSDPHVAGFYLDTRVGAGYILLLRGVRVDSCLQFVGEPSLSNQKRGIVVRNQ